MTRLKYIIATCIAGCALSGAIASAAQAVEILPAGESFTASSGNTQLTYSIATLKCPESHAAGSVNSPAPTSKATLTSLTFGPAAKCTTNLGASITSVETTASASTPWTLTALVASGEGNGTGQVEIPSAGGATIITSGFLANCEIKVLGGQNAAVSLKKGPPNLLIAEASLSATAKEHGGSCGLSATGTSKFTGEYEITAAKPIEILAAPAVRCAVVAEAGTGRWDNAACNVEDKSNEYIKVLKGKSLGGKIECAVVAEVPVGRGVYNDANCTEKGGGKEYIKAIE